MSSGRRAGGARPAAGAPRGRPGRPRLAGGRRQAERRRGLRVPPGLGDGVARLVAAAGFGGLYVDANAIAPGTARAVGRIVAAAGADFVDGGIIGPPPRHSGTTRLYLAGPRAGEVAAPLQGERARGHRDARRHRRRLGPQDGLRRVDEGLERPPPGRAGAGDPRGRGPRAPRRVGALPARPRARSEAAVAEREEGLAVRRGDGRDRPDLRGRRAADGFHEACAAIYSRLGRYKDAPAAPSMREVADALGTRTPGG